MESFQALFEHLEVCPDCAGQFDQLSATDQAVRRTFQKLPESPLLESRILAGLTHQRANTGGQHTFWKAWFLLPVAAVLLIAVTLGLLPRFQEERLGREVAGLLSVPPALQIDSSDRNELLRWSDSVLPGLSSLPTQLNRVEFRGAAAVRVANHKAILLKMKNEPRASLLILDNDLLRQQRLRSIHEQAGSAALWSDQNRTYVLLFEGSITEMHDYMDRMGIAS